MERLFVILVKTGIYSHICSHNNRGLNMKIKLMIISILLLICFTSCGNPWLDSILNSDSNKKDDNIGKGFTGIDDIIEWLKSQPGGSISDPILLSLSIPLGYMPGGTWEDLLNAIDGTGKYVNLDLSNCSINGTTFNSATANPAGYDKVVSIVLPNQAQNIESYSFLYFTSLNQVTGMNIKEIDDDAFANCLSLKNVSFPLAKDIGDYAFTGCPNLQSVNLPLATNIGESAFASCSSLQSVFLPSATSIGNGAFRNCYTLQNVNIPLIIYIGDGVFANTGIEPLTITMGFTPPTLGQYIFDGAGSGKTITVQVPLIAFPLYDLDWENGFKGMGWDSGSPQGGTLNTNINLTVLSLP